MGHDEAETLHNAFAQVARAVAPGDPVWFVDSASTDGSAAVAQQHGAEVVAAPLGKGRAISRALDRCETRHLCFVDGDLFGSTHNIPLALRSALDKGDPDMVVAEFDWPAKRLWSVTAGIYTPLVGALFPEAVGHVGRTAFSGFRILRTDLAIGALPTGFGAETYLNIRSATQGWATRVVDIGAYEGVVRKHPTWGPEIAAVILDAAQAAGRLEPARRPAWDAWVAEVCLVLRDEPDPDADPGDYTERLVSAIDRPLPSRSL